MNDRELLELAAKAAGVCGKFSENHPEDGAPCYSCGINLGSRVQILWNPLTDDGDALRLAVKLALHLANEHQSAGCVTVLFGVETTCHYMNEVEESAPAGGDDYAATRRAITRAAAEIGRAMK
ncbi:hypothetical protein AH02_56 [Pseudomonas phage AH02]|nr:hypothetical protein AH02_56 [Pseudomonas phage AH02]